MDHFAGLDVSVKETSICIVDDTGKIVWKAGGQLTAVRGWPAEQHYFFRSLVSGTRAVISCRISA